MNTNKCIHLICIFLIFMLSGVSSDARYGEWARDGEWIIHLNPTEEITDFKLIDGNTAILLGVTDINPVTKKEVFKVLKVGLPKGNKYWERRYPCPIWGISSTPKETCFLIICDVGEYDLPISEIINGKGKIIATFAPRKRIEQRNVFLINDSYYISAVDTEIGIAAYLERFSTVMEIRSLPDNKLIRSIDIKGELIDVVPWGAQGVRMIVSMSKGKVPPFPEPWYRDQELLQSRDILSDPIRKIGDVSKGVARDELDDFFIDDSTIVSESDYHNRYSLHISQDRVTKVPLEFIRSEANMPGDILYYKKYKGTVLYFLNRGGNRVISIAINEGKEDPFRLLRKYSGERERIELGRSAFYRIGKEAFFLKIPEKERNKIVIRKVE